LFNLNESIATFKALRAQGTPVKLIWQSWGPSNGTPAPGEIDLGALDPSTQYQTARVLAWFERYLKNRGVNTGPTFAYFRDWVSYSGIATPAYGTSSTYPVGAPRSFYLSGTSLATSSASLAKSTRTFLTPAAGLPTSTSEPDAIGSVAKLPVPEVDLPGTFLNWTSAPLTSSLRVVGTPVLTTQVKAPAAAAAQALGPAGQLVLFVRLQDVDPEGEAKDLRLLSAPIRIQDVTKPFSVTLPAIVYQFAKGHSLRLVIAGGSLNYRGGVTPQTVQITTGTSAHQLRLPTVG
jgi:ABC-2 type transport system ATP-binding protein